MVAFFNSLNILEMIFFILASVASILLIIQIIMLIIGFSGSDMGDVDGYESGVDDLDTEAGADLSLITIKGLIAFFSIGGWVGLALSREGVHPALTIIIAFISGTVALVGIAYLYKLGYKLQSNGNIKLSNAVGLTGKVYLTIPPKGKGSGKVNITVQERYIECEAIQNGDLPIKTDDLVKVVESRDNILIVERV